MRERPLKSRRWFLPSRRWLRFSLRAFLVWVLFVTISMGWLGKRLADKRAEHALGVLIGARGGRIGYPSLLDARRSQPVLQWVGKRLGEHNLASEIVLVELSPNTQAKWSGDLVPQITRRLPALEWLMLHDTGIGDADLREIEKLTKLSFLHLSGNEIGDETAFRLSKLSELEYLMLDFTDISDEGLDRLVQLPRLGTLGIRSTNVTPRGVERFRAARTDVSVCWAPRLTDPNMAAARKLRQCGWQVECEPEETRMPPLVHVVPPDNETLPPETERALLTTFPRVAGTIYLGHGGREAVLTACFVGLENLESLVAHGLDDEELAALRGSTRLRSLSISESSITEAGLAKLAELPRLKELLLYDTCLSPSMVGSIASIKDLRRLTVAYNCDFDDEVNPEYFALGVTRSEYLMRELAALKELEYLELWEIDDAGANASLKLTNLTGFVVTDSGLSDQGLAALSQHPALKELTCYAGNGITPEGLARFQKLRPDVVLCTD